MTRWVEWCRTHSTDLIRDKDRGNDYGDWLSIGADTPKDLIGTAYFAYSTSLVAKSLRALGKDDEAAKYEQLFQDIKAAFNKRYVAADGRIKGNTQCCYAMALKFDLLPEELRPKAAQYLEDDIKAKGWHLSTGFVGVSYLLPVLTDGGQTRHGLPPADAGHVPLLAVLREARRHHHLGTLGRLDAGEGLPGPGHELVQSLLAGFLRRMAVRLRRGHRAGPRAARLPAHHHPSASRRRPDLGPGQPAFDPRPIASAWTLTDGKFTLDVTIPANTTATVYVPAGREQSLTESGKPVEQAEGVRLVRMEGGIAVLQVGSGTYHFQSH